MTNFPESFLVIPALKVLIKHNGAASTSELIKDLTDLLHPCGSDGEILLHRSDTKFSQKVRNLKSHKTLSKLGYANETHDGWHITEEGRRYIDRVNNLLNNF